MTPLLCDSGGVGYSADQGLLRLTPSPWNPRQRERKHCQWQYKTKRERCLSKLNSFSFSFCTCGAACALSALVIPAGFEPTTHSLEGCCSIQLSYGTIAFIIHLCADRRYTSALMSRCTVCMCNYCGAKVSKIYRIAKFLGLSLRILLSNGHN